MAAILLAVCQILFLLLSAYFDTSRDQERARAKVKEAQEKLDEIATRFELQVRYSQSTTEEIDRLEDLMTPPKKARKNNESP